MKKTKIALTLVCAVLLVAASVMGTLAYLTATTQTVTNTFTVGNVSFAGAGLDEAKVNQYGEKLDTNGNVYEGTAGQTLAARVIANEYKLVPGHTYVKDPTVHIAANTEECWLFVKVVNPIAAIEADTTIAAQMATNGWALVDATNAPGVYAYNTKILSSSAVQDIEVFKSFTVKSDATLATNYEPITIQAGIVQADGFATAAAAWAANSTLFPSAT